MGVMTETAMLQQIKKGQGETKDQLDQVLTEMRRTNELLGWLCERLATSGAPVG